MSMEPMKSAHKPAMNEDAILTVEHLSMRFGGLIAVDDLSFAARRGEITALIGPNGAGKTTVFNCITGFYKPTQGMVSILRANGSRFLLERMPDFQITAKAKVARTFQNIRLFSGMTVLENLLVAQHNTLMVASGFTVGGLFGLTGYRDAEKQSIELAKFWMDRAQLTERADDPAGDLPYGAQRRLEIARAMCTGPELLCLDEPAAGLNPRESAALNKMLLDIKHDTGTSILLIEHDMSVVMEISDHVVVLEYGRKISDGSAEFVRNDPKVIAAYLGVEDEDEIDIPAVRADLESVSGGMGVREALSDHPGDGTAQSLMGGQTGSSGKSSVKTAKSASTKSASKTASKPAAKASEARTKSTSAKVPPASSKSTATRPAAGSVETKPTAGKSTPAKSTAAKPTAAKSAPAKSTSAKPAKPAATGTTSEKPAAGKATASRSASASPQPAAAGKTATAAPTKSGSVKAAATAKQATGKPAASRTVAAPSSASDNLTLIKGIGRVNERKLVEHGITRFEQIAGWKQADIRAAEAYLEFDGRIAREEWVKQAKTLAKGGTTEFSKRAASGKVETSRASSAPGKPRKGGKQ